MKKKYLTILLLFLGINTLPAMAREFRWTYDYTCEKDCEEWVDNKWTNIGDFESFLVYYQIGSQDENGWICADAEYNPDSRSSDFDVPEDPFETVFLYMTVKFTLWETPHSNILELKPEAPFPVCGNINDTVVTYVPAVSALCSAGEPVGFDPASGMPYQWNCEAGGLTVPCYTLAPPLNGVCGLADGGVFDALPSNYDLCDVGIPLGIPTSPEGDIHYECYGEAGGVTANCLLTIMPSPPPPPVEEPPPDEPPPPPPVEEPPPDEPPPPPPVEEPPPDEPPPPPPVEEPPPDEPPPPPPVEEPPPDEPPPPPPPF